MSVNIQFKDIRNMADLYRQFAEQAEISVDFGNNLDALYDELSANLQGPIQITWHDFNAAQALLGEASSKALLELFTDVATERADFQFTISKGI